MKRFFDKINKTENCWLWTAATRGKTGYGAFKYKGKVVDAHRLSYELHNGPIEKGLLVCHKCDIKLCVNPDHLYLGTYKQNLLDTYARTARKKRPVTIVHGTKNAYNYLCRCSICKKGQKDRLQQYRLNKKS